MLEKCVKSYTMQSEIKILQQFNISTYNWDVNMCDLKMPYRVPYKFASIYRVFRTIMKYNFSKTFWIVQY